MRRQQIVRTAATLVLVILVALSFGAPLPAGAGYRPLVEGRNGAISAGDPRTTAAGYQILLKGGNAFDAGVAALLAAGVVEQDLFSLGGEGLILVYDRRAQKVTSIVGQGWAGSKATVDWFLDKGKSLEGEGLDPSTVPGAIHAALTVLERWGTMSFEEVVGPALDYAENGFVLRARTASSIHGNLDFFKKWPDNQRYWLKPDGTEYKPGEVIKLPDLANTLKKMIAAEQAAKGQGRTAGIVAARDRFYKGDIGDEMFAFLQANNAQYIRSDISDFYARVEEPTSTTYRGYTVYKQGFNSQGPSLLQTLNILENFDLAAMKLNSADYIHTLIEAMKLAYADRDTFYADPDFVKIPQKGLLSKAYAAERAKLINPAKAFVGQVAGDPMKYDPDVKTWSYWVANTRPSGAAAPGSSVAPGSLLAASAGVEKDTTHISVMDRNGNIFDSTPSGGWIGGGVILGRTGIGMSVRGEQFFLDKERAQQIRPRSRPRYTLTPSLVLKDGQPFMAIGTPGGDNQEQTILQAFLDIVTFWKDWYPNLHTANDWPRVQTLSFYGSFWPHDISINAMNVEAPIPDAVFQELVKRGHKASRIRAYGMSGCATIVMRDPATGRFLAAGDERRECYAMAY